MIDYTVNDYTIKVFEEPIDSSIYLSFGHSFYSDTLTHIFSNQAKFQAITINITIHNSGFSSMKSSPVFVCNKSNIQQLTNTRGKYGY